MLTKLRSLPCSLYRCAFRPLCLRVRSASSSPTVAPDTSTASCLSVYGRSGVGISIFAMMETALFEARSIVLEIPHGHVRCPAVRDGDNHVRERRPRVIEIVLRRPRRVIRVRMVEPEELRAELRRAALRSSIIGVAHAESPARALVRDVRQRQSRHEPAVASDERPAALVRIRLLAVTPNHAVELPGQHQRAITHRPSKSSRSSTFPPRRETP